MNDPIKTAIIHVCDISDVQVKEKQDHIIDSSNSVPGSINNDIIVGGILILYALLLLDDQLLRQNGINKHFAKKREYDFIDSDGCGVVGVEQRKSINRDQVVCCDISKKMFTNTTKRILSNGVETASVIVGNLLENVLFF